MKLSYKTNIFLLSCILILSLIVLWLWFFNKLASANFKQVDVLGESVLLVGIRDSNFIVTQNLNHKILKDNLIKSIKYSYSRATPFRFSNSGKKACVGIDNTLIVMDSLKKNDITCEEFGYPKYKISTILGMNENTIWFALSKKGHIDKVLEWEIEKPPSTVKTLNLLHANSRCEAHLNPYINRPTGIKDLIINKNSSKIYFGSEQPLVLPFINKKILNLPKTHDLNSYEFFDFDKKFGWLMSLPYVVDYSPKTELKIEWIVYISLDGVPKKIAKGAHAVWGADGYVYYLNMEGALCRIKPNSSTIEMVIDSFYREHHFERCPLVTKNRRFILYNIATVQNSLIKGIATTPVVLDVLKKEYRIINSGQQLSDRAIVFPDCLRRNR